MLLTLPNELLCLIAKHLDNRQDLYHLASACQRLHENLQHKLFTTITLCNEDPVQMFLQVSGFLARILQSPAIAAEVRFLDLGNWSSFYVTQIYIQFNKEEASLCKANPTPETRSKGGPAYLGVSHMSDTDFFKFGNPLVGRS